MLKHCQTNSWKKYYKMMEELSIEFLVRFCKYEFDSITFMLLIFVVHEHEFFLKNNLRNL